MTVVESFVDPSCPWAWITSRWLKEVAPHRDLEIAWRSYCLEIRDDYGVAATVPEEFREAALAGHALSHRMLRIFEAARARSGEGSVDALYTAWGEGFFVRGVAPDAQLLPACLPGGRRHGCEGSGLLTRRRSTARRDPAPCRRVSTGGPAWFPRAQSSREDWVSGPLFSGR